LGVSTLGRNHYVYALTGIKVTLALLSNQDTDKGKETISKILSFNYDNAKKGAFLASQPDPERFFCGLVVDTYKSIGFEIGHYLDFEEGYSDESFEKALSCPFINLSIYPAEILSVF
jgi:hypothetical protein